VQIVAGAAHLARPARDPVFRLYRRDRAVRERGEQRAARDLRLRVAADREPAGRIAVELPQPLAVLEVERSDGLLARHHEEPSPGSRWLRGQLLAEIGPPAQPAGEAVEGVDDAVAAGQVERFALDQGRRQD